MRFEDHALGFTTHVVRASNSSWARRWRPPKLGEFRENPDLVPDWGMRIWQKSQNLVRIEIKKTELTQWNLIHCRTRTHPCTSTLYIPIIRRNHTNEWKHCNFMNTGIGSPLNTPLHWVTHIKSTVILQIYRNRGFGGILEMWRSKTLPE